LRARRSCAPALTPGDGESSETFDRAVEVAVAELRFLRGAVRVCRRLRWRRRHRVVEETPLRKHPELPGLGHHERETGRAGGMGLPGKSREAPLVGGERLFQGGDDAVGGALPLLPEPLGLERPVLYDEAHPEPDQCDDGNGRDGQKGDRQVPRNPRPP
jgi:hypothetical protein